MTAGILRGAAIAIAIGGVMDPACDVRSSERPILAVEIVDAPSMALPAAEGGTRRDLAERVRRALADRLADEWNVVDGPVSTASALVLIGDTAPPVEPAALREQKTGPTPIHAVSVGSILSPNVRIVHAGAPRRITIWDRAAVTASIEGRGLAGQAVMVRLSMDGIPLSSAEHRWRAEVDTFEAQLSFLPPAAGAHRLEIEASSVPDERSELDNRVSLLVEADAQKRRVLVYQPRLSWMATFVARALERDPRLELSSRARASSGIAVAAGKDRDAFEAFDVIVVGAPDSLTRAEVEALTSYVTVRGGSLLLLADRRPAGPSLSLSPAETFDEVLLQKPADLAPGLRASEMSVARRPRSGWEPIAMDGKRPVMMAAPRGRGRLVFSGALDAWRYREGSRYWQDLVAALAARTPRPVDIRLEPAIARPGERVEVSSNASVARARGEIIRLWPGGEPGVFRGVLRAPVDSGLIPVAARQAGAQAEATLSIDRAAAHPWSDPGVGLETFAAAHGGTYVGATDITPLVSALRPSAERRQIPRTVRPMRSVMWMIPFTALLAAEWTLRRRRHLH